MQHKLLGSYQKAGALVLKSWSSGSCVAPVPFLALCSGMHNTIHELPVICVLPFLIHAVVYFGGGSNESSFDPGSERTAAFLRNCLPESSSPELSKIVELALELFEHWESIFPVRFSYDSEKATRVNLAWEQEVCASELKVPSGASYTVFEEFRPWMLTVTKITQSQLPPCLREAARIYFLHREFCVDFDSSSASEIISYASYRGQGYQAPQIRDNHLQMIISSIWTKLRCYAECLSQTTSSMASTRNVGFDEALIRTVSPLVLNLCIASHVIMGSGENFIAVHPQMWVSLSLNQTSRSYWTSCDKCMEGDMNRTDDLEIVSDTLDSLSLLDDDLEFFTG